VDVVPKFQAVQAAHEILNDPDNKRKYDLERAKHKANAPAFPRRGPVPPTPSAYPPPPRRAPTSASKQNAFTGNANTTRARQPVPAGNAEKYAPYARASAQQWEKTKEEAQSRQDAFRGFQQMKPGQSPSRERFPPTPPPRPNRYNAGPRPTSYAPQSAGFMPASTPSARKSWDDFEKAGRSTTTGTEPSPGFPGMSRAQSQRKKHGFTPTTPGGDEPPAPRSSAYVNSARGERPQVPNAQTYFPEASPHGSPQLTPQRSARNVSGRARSSSKPEEQNHPDRPGLERVSTRYSSIGGERTDVSSTGVGRSSSVRNSPVDPGWRDPGRGGLRHAYSHEVPSEHRSVSPRSRPPPAPTDSSSSGSETSSDEDIPDQKWAARPKATPRQTYPTPHASNLGGPAAPDGQAYAAQYPSTSYVRPPLGRDTESNRFQYGPHPPPPPPRSQPTSQAAFSYVPGYSGARPAAPKVVPSGGNGYAGPGMAHNEPNMYAPPFSPHPLEWSRHAPPLQSRIRKSVPSLNGYPSWAVPSSVLPGGNETPLKRPLFSTGDERSSGIGGWRLYTFNEPFAGRPHKQGRYADPDLTRSPSETEAADTHAQARSRSTSQEPTSNRFSASEWNQKFATEEIFRPSTSYNSGKRSPVRPLRSRAKTPSKARLSPSRESRNNSSAGLAGATKEDRPSPSEAFVPGSFSADEWMEKLRMQNGVDSNGADGTRPFERGSDGSTTKQQPAQAGFNFPAPAGGPAYRDLTGDTARGSANGNGGVDLMDIDDPSSVNTPPNPVDARGSTRSSQANVHEPSRTTAVNASKPHTLHRAPGHVDLDSLSNVAPFRPSNAGLGDLQDLNTTLPFESQASRTRPTQPTINGTGFSSLKALNLPKPPKEVIPPLENVTQESWTRYTNETSGYMREWEIFNRKMLDHFQARQAQLEISLKPNWMSALGDGPGVEEINQKVQEDPDAGRNLKVGYAAYRQWLEGDMKVREWWNLACERHLQAVIELGKVREKAKTLA
jgi:hypothetical protein